MKLVDLVLSLLVPGLILLHLVVAPYTKVEESFNIQATHDVLVYGTPVSDIYNKLSSNYDHFSFPGAVPRTFVGSVLLAGVSQPIIAALGFNHAQFVIRALLGLYNGACLLVFRRNFARAYGAPAARWYILLQATQFHVIFYASRTLPNMFAFGLTTLAFAFLLPHPNPRAANPRQRLAITLFVFAAVIFRSETALLLGTSALFLLIIPQTSLGRLVLPFVVAFTVALAISVPIDSYFWQRLLWPELWGFYYNAVLGASSNWGVSPWHYYFTSALPRLLMNPLAPALLIPVAWRHPATARATRNLIVPSLLFVAIYSLQPHKEARFIFYVAPPLTGAAALGANVLFAKRTKSVASGFLALVVAASVVLTLAASIAMLLVSALNYPGGEALAHLRVLVTSPAATVSSTAALVPVHADVLACMTGVTLFGAATGAAMPRFHALGGPRSGPGSLLNLGTHDGGDATMAAPAVTLAIDKTEDDLLLLQRPEFWQRFDYVLTEDPETIKGGEWDVVGLVKGYAGAEVLTPSSAEPSGMEDEHVVGGGVVVASLRDRVRSLTGGWWVGPKMAPRIYILKRIKEADRVDKAVDT